MHIDPWWFHDEAVDPVTQAFVDDLARAAAELPHPADLPPEVVRRAREEGRSLFGPLTRSPLARDRTIEGPAGPLPLRVFDLGTRTGLYLHIHGGGWVLGAPHHQDRALEALARTTGMVGVSVGYRLAPEHPWPAAVDDCVAAARWLLDEGSAEFGVGALAIGGESAGAHLSVLTLLALRAEGRGSAFRAANLVFGVYDLGLTPSVRMWDRGPLVLDRRSMAWFVDLFLSGPDAPDPRDPRVSPLYADLLDLPAALFTVGTWDPLVDDSLWIAARWASAGNRAELAVYPGGVHAFTYFPDLPLAAVATRRMHRFLADAVGQRATV